MPGSADKKADSRPCKRKRLDKVLDKVKRQSGSEDELRLRTTIRIKIEKSVSTNGEESRSKIKSKKFCGRRLLTF